MESMDIMMEHLNNGLWLTLLLSLPAVLIAAFIGVAVGILQAVTQVQEQTLSAAPKILCVFLLLIFTGGLMLTLMTNYIRESAYIAFDEIPHAENTVLPPRAESDGEKWARDYFKKSLSVGSDGKVKSFFRQPAHPGDVNTPTGHIGFSIHQGAPTATPSTAEQMYLRKQGR